MLPSLPLHHHPALPVHADDMNHVCYSIHSVAYLKKGNANNPLQDANSTIELNPGGRHPLRVEWDEAHAVAMEKARRLEESVRKRS